MPELQDAWEAMPEVQNRAERLERAIHSDALTGLRRAQTKALLKEFWPDLTEEQVSRYIEGLRG